MIRRRLLAAALGVFGLGAGVVLCFACAVSRGGSYDEADDRWVSEPDTSGLEAELD